MKTKKALAAVLGMTMLSGSFVVSAPAEVKAADKKLVFWDKSEYVAAYNDMMKAKLDEFAEANGVDVEYVIVPSGDIKQKLAAAIESGNQPDLIMGDNTLVAEYINSDQLAEVDDVLENIDFKENALRYATFNDKNYLVPLSFTAPGMYIRKDKWEEKGLDMPTTWEELKEDAEKINDPENGFYALGLPLGASGGGDAESFVRTVILDFGGRLVDENGKVVLRWLDMANTRNVQLMFTIDSLGNVISNMVVPRDTIYLPSKEIYVDRKIQVPYPVEKKLSRWEQFKMDVGGWAIGVLSGLLLFGIGYVIVWLIKKRR